MASYYNNTMIKNFIMSSRFLRDVYTLQAKLLSHLDFFLTLYDLLEDKRAENVANSFWL